MEPLRETLQIALHDIRQSIRSTKAILLLVIYGLGAVGSGAVLVWILSRIEQGFEQQVALAGIPAAQAEATRAQAYQELMSYFVEDPQQATYLASFPIIVLFFFWANRVFLPWLIVLMGYDQIAGELHNRSVRYVLLRARRGSLIAGKLLSNLAILVVLTLVTHLLVLGFAAWRVPGFEMGAALGGMLRFGLLSLSIGFAWLAIMSFLSSLFRYPYYALMTGFAVLIVSGLVGWIGQGWEAMSFLQWLVPWRYDDFMLSHQLGTQLLGVLGFLGFAALFSALSYLILRNRDV